MTQAPATSELEPTWISVKSDDLRRMPFDQLVALADRVGVGYTGLDEETLRQKLILEGIPQE